jgi:lipopolysaccharide/colanic/teichoic acid biosynthesis glycosyltransferase
MMKVQLFLKRAFDLVASTLAAIILIPLWLIVAISIKIDSKGPVFFKQGRLTKDGKVFQMLKFRSMVVNAEHMGTGLFNYENDPRVTRVGRFLRNTSIDELPQLFNVIAGDISIVGPRPAVVYELGDYATLNKKYKKRFSVKGGITGLAQCKGRNENSWDEKVTLDNQYIDLFEKEGVWTDIKVIWWTVSRVFAKKDIYEEKYGVGLSDVESAELSDEEIKRIAHLPDEE